MSIHRLTSAFALLALAATISIPARAATTSMDVVNKAVAASSTLDAPAFDGLYAKNAVFVDEGPYIGYGANAGHVWAAEIQKRFAQRKMTQFKVTPSAPTVAQEKGDSAYVVVPMKLDGHLGSGAHYHEDGAFTFTLQRESGTWKITSQVWTVLSRVITPDGKSAVIHHQVSNIADAQVAFDRGLLDYYAYNPEAAEHEFYTAADLDKKLAMAYWGIALSNAPNLNVPATDDRDAKARRAIRRAKALEQNASPEDRAFIDAAAARFDGAPKAHVDTLETAYRDALLTIANANPNDPDAAALYAEAALSVAFIGGYGYDSMTPGQRTAFTAGMAALMPYFQANLAKFPQHVGLLHFYIHTAQGARRSADAVDAAKQLAAFTFPPEDSHLTHMPGHTFFDVGMYKEALDVGTRSIAMDEADYACCHPGYYAGPRYYHGHNVNFALYAMSQTGHAADAIELARSEDNPAMIVRTLTAAGQWHDVIALPYSKGSDPTIPFARGIAYAKVNNTADAKAMLSDIPDAPADQPARAAIVSAMRKTLAAEIAIVQADDATALALLTDASASAISGDKLGGAEMPSLYYFSPHMALAGVATRLGKMDVAKAALQAELIASPRSSTALDALAKLNSPR